MSREIGAFGRRETASAQYYKISTELTLKTISSHTDSRCSTDSKVSSVMKSTQKTVNQNQYVNQCVNRQDSLSLNEGRCQV